MSDKTSKIIASMLVENTGRNLFDSGGEPKYDADGKYIGSRYGYGRAFERNRGSDFESESGVVLKYDHDYISLTFNLYHWLKQKLTYDEDLDDLFHTDFVEAVDQDESKSWLELSKEFPEWLSNVKDEDGKFVYENVSGIYGEGDPFTNYTYNNENLLSQDIQYTFFTTSNEEYVVLQVHNGCDARSGLTKPRVFSLNDELCVLDYNKATIYCTGKDYHPTVLGRKELQEKQVVIAGVEPSNIDFGGDHYWTTDNGHNFSEDGCYGGKYTQLDKLEVIELDEEDDDGKKPEWTLGFLCVDEDGVMYCPRCGAKLAGSSN